MLKRRGIRLWDFSDPRFLELKYEDVFGREETTFRRLFQHYGFSPEAIEKSVSIASGFNFDKVRKSGSHKGNQHLRAGHPGQWRELFSQSHVDHFKERLGDILILAGYESGVEW